MFDFAAAFIYVSFAGVAAVSAGAILKPLFTAKK